MTSSEKFCLRWNNFESNISVAFREIREEKDFFDCTLSCGSRQIQAHKLILSACSPFFRSILKQNPHQHPLLYLKGVEFADLQAVLNFMYHGEVSVAQEELNSFLTVAEDLKVKGLTQNSEQATAQKTQKELVIAKPPNHRRTDNENQRLKPSRYLTPSASAPASYQDDDVQEVPPVVKQEPHTQVPDPSTPSQQMAPMPQTADHPEIFSQFSHQASTVAQVDDSYGEDGYDEYGEYEGEEGAVMEYSSHHNSNTGSLETSLSYAGLNCMIHEIEKGIFACTECGKSSRNKKDLKRHIASKHMEGEPVRCELCGKQYKHKPSLQVHISQKHREEYLSLKKQEQYF